MGGAKFCRFALLPLMLLMLLLLPTRMVAQTEHDKTVTLTALAGNPVGYTGKTDETYKNLFDGKKKEGDFTKWCCKFNGSAYVIFEASKAGVPVGYTITTGNDNANFGCGGRNPLSWKLYGNNEGEEGEWVLIQAVENDTKLQDKNFTSYDFTCEGSTSYKYFKWEISAIHSGGTMQVGEFELKLNTCSHKNADGSDALGAVIETVDPTCAEHGYTTHECSLCHSTVKVYKDDELKAHTLTHHEATSDIKEHWQCDVCHKYFSDSNATQEVTYGSLLFDQAYAMFDDATETLTFSYGTKPEGAYALNQERPEPEWRMQKISTVVFDASFAYARPTSCSHWFKDCIYLTRIEGIWNLNTENVTDMSRMFQGCCGLTSLDVSKFNTSKVTDMCSMFQGCYGLTSLDVSKFNTSNVTDMSDMFEDCYALTSLDLTNFDTGKVKDMLFMFYGCSALTTIYASNKFVTDKVTDNGSKMFYGCKNLKGFIEYNKNTDTDKNNSKFANYKTGYFTNLVGKNGDEKIGAVGEILTAENLTLNDEKDFVAYEKFAAKDATYSREMKTGITWGTLCLPFAIDQSKETECKFYRLTGIDNDNDCITLESYEEGAKIPAGTPVLFKMNEGVQKLEISAQNAELVKEPVAGTNTDVNLVGSFTKIGGKDNQGLTDTDYIIGKDKFWLVSELKKDGNSKGVGIKPMRAYIHPATAAQARAAMLSIGKGDGTTVIDNLNAISNDANAEYYDANGRRTNGLQKGLNIVKRGSKTYKIMVK